MIPFSQLKEPSGTSPVYQLLAPPGYLSAGKGHGQTLCRNIEGWGPLSPFRYDFTPCFLDVWIAAVAGYGFVFGLGAIWYLLRKNTPEPVPKNWHFWTKLAVIGGLGVTTAVQAALQILEFKELWAADFRFWATILTLVSLGTIGTVQYYEHWRSRNPNGVVLFYWLLLLISFAVKLRSLVSQQTYKTHLPYFVVFCIGVGLAGLEFVLEWLVRKNVSAYEALGDEFECPYEYTTVFGVLTFSWMTPLMKYGYKQFLTQDDLWNLRKRDSARATSDAFETAWDCELEKKSPSMWIAMFRGSAGHSLGERFSKLSATCCLSCSLSCLDC